jgi:hypothetical protein
VVAINELVAPVMYRHALIRSGEVGQKRKAVEPATAPEPGLLLE